MKNPESLESHQVVVHLSANCERGSLIRGSVVYSGQGYSAELQNGYLLIYFIKNVDEIIKAKNENKQVPEIKKMLVAGFKEFESFEIAGHGERS